VQSRPADARNDSLADRTTWSLAQATAGTLAGESRCPRSLGTALDADRPACDRWNLPVSCAIRGDNFRPRPFVGPKCGVPVAGDGGRTSTTNGGRSITHGESVRDRTAKTRKTYQSHPADGE